MATHSTAADLATFDDIIDGLTQDPVTKLWSGNAAAIATALNNDYRHVYDCKVEDVWRVIWTELEMVTRNVGIEADPANDDPFTWIGLFDDHHRALPNTGTINQIKKEGWRKAILHGPNSDTAVDCTPSYRPQASQVDDRLQRNGLLLAEWNELCQDICVNASYNPVLSTQYKDDEQAVFDLWVSLTGGRRFGACTDVSIQALIDAQNANEDRQLAFGGAQDVRTRAQAAIDAANAEYQSNPSATAASVIAAGDAAYNA